MTHQTERHKLVARLSVDTELGSFLGDTRIRLLEAIARYGSISRAAKAVPMSYKSAWDAIDTMNNLAEAPLVASSVGGRQGGGTLLTPYGDRLVAMYRAVELEYQEAMDRLSHEADTADHQAFRRLLRRMAVKTSARNQFVATVAAMRHSQVSTVVSLAVDDGLNLTATITRESVEGLGLSVGKEVYAFIKASSVILSTDRVLRTSARNHLWGEVSRIHQGVVDAEVTLSIPGSRTVTAIVTRESAETLGLAIGRPACAIFKASSVILAVIGG